MGDGWGTDSAVLGPGKPNSLNCGGLCKPGKEDLARGGRSRRVASRMNLGRNQSQRRRQKRTAASNIDPERALNSHAATDRRKRSAVAHRPVGSLRALPSTVADRPGGDVRGCQRQWPVIGQTCPSRSGFSSSDRQLWSDASTTQASAICGPSSRAQNPSSEADIRIPRSNHINSI
jgi:hypothetical protein